MFNSRKLSVVFSAALLTVFSACGGGGGGGNPPVPSDGASESVTSADNAANPVAVFGRAGGSLENAGVTLPTGTVPGGESYTIELTPASAQAVQDFEIVGGAFQLTATDSASNPVTFTQNVTVSVPYGGSLPVGTTTSDLRVMQLKSGQSSPDVLAGTATTRNGGNVVEVEVTSFSTFWCTVFIDPGSQGGIEISTTSLPQATALSAYSETVQSANGSGAITWTLTAGNLPPGLVLNSGDPDATIVGTPTASGSYSFFLRVEDSATSDVQQFTIEVAQAPLAIQTPTPSEGFVGTNYSLEVTAEGGSSSGYSWSVSSGSLPDGLSITDGTPTATISGTPTLDGTFNFDLQVEDSDSNTTTQSVSITINSALEIIDVNPANAFIGESYTLDLSATGGSGSGYVWDISAGGLPLGLSLNGNGASATISGDPTTAGVGNFTLRVVDDASNEATLATSIVVIPQPTIITTSLPAGTVSAAYNFSLVGADGETPYTWSILTGSLPSGMSLSPSGVLSGTPTVDGNFDVAIQLEDDGGRTDSETFSLQIALAGSPAQIQNFAAAYNPVLNKLTLNWTATGAIDNTGTADAYELRTSTSPIDVGNFGSASAILIPAPQIAGSAESAEVDVNWYSGDHYFAIRAINNQQSTQSAITTLGPINMDLNSSFPGSSANFGIVQSGNTGSDAFAVANNATYVNLVLSSVTLNGDSEFAFQGAINDPYTIPPGQQVSFTVDFSPNSGGSFNANLSLNHNDAAVTPDPFIVTLNGDGAAAQAPPTITNTTDVIIEVEDSFNITVVVDDPNSNLPGTNDVSTVTADLSSIGGSATQALTASAGQSGTSGEWSATGVSSVDVPTGEYVIPLTATDSANNVVIGEFTLIILNPNHAPEVFHEFPAANDSGTANFPSNAKAVIIFSRPIDTASVIYGFIGNDPDATVVFTLDDGQNNFVQINGNQSITFATGIKDMDNRIMVVDSPPGFANGVSMGLTLYGGKSTNAPGVGIIGTNSARLLTKHKDARFVASGGDPAAGFQWAPGAADNTIPTLTPSPAASSSNSGSGVHIVLEFNEAINPNTLGNFELRDGSNNLIAGDLVIEPETLEAVTFRPTTALSTGTYNVSVAGIEDLAGNALTNGSNYSFTVNADTQAPVIDLLTMNGLPFYLNGDPSNGGGVQGGGKLLTHPNGFTIDLEYHDLGGSGISPTLADFLITSNTVVQGPSGAISASTNLTPTIGASNATISASEASFLIPSNMSFPTGDSMITVSIKDREGNTSQTKTFTFAVSNSGVEPFAPGLGANNWKYHFERDFEDITFNFAGNTMTVIQDLNTTASNPDGTIDWLQDLEGMGFRDPGNSGTVSGSSLTMNAAAENFLKNRILYHSYRHFGISVDIADGNTNPGLATLNASPTPNTIPGSINVGFQVITNNPTNEDRMAFGGYRDSSVLGTALLDKNNQERDTDNGVVPGLIQGSATIRGENLGIFTSFYIMDQHGFVGDGVNPVQQVGTYSSGAPEAYYFDETSPFAIAGVGDPVGSNGSDAAVLSPTSNPATFNTAQSERYRRLLRALDAFAQTISVTAVHEVGHSVGLVENGVLGTGLYGNQSVPFPGSDSYHVELEPFYAGNGQNIMSKDAGFQQALSRFTGFGELSMAYFRNQIIVP